MTIKEKDAIRYIYLDLKEKYDAEFFGNCDVKTIAKYKEQMEGVKRVMKYFGIYEE